jgi:uncharacterized membrane protein YuzA (DUF378 family)
MHLNHLLIGVINTFNIIESTIGDQNSKLEEI